MTEKGRITVNEVDIVEVSSDPSVSPGVAASIGSLAILDADDVYQKFGSGNTDWAPISRDIRSGIVANTSFSGDPRKCTVVFTRPMPSVNYKISINGSSDVRNWTYEAKTVNGFIINSNAKAALTGEVSWDVIQVGETA